MAKILNSRCVLAVRDLKISTRYYTDILGFSKDPIDAEGWSFLTRDTFRVMHRERSRSQYGCILPRRTGEAYRHAE